MVNSYSMEWKRETFGISLGQGCSNIFEVIISATVKLSIPNLACYLICERLPENHNQRKIGQSWARKASKNFMTLDNFEFPFFTIYCSGYL